MSFNDCKISESQIQTTGVQSQADTLTGSAADNKKVFDALPTLVIQKLNSLIDQMQQQAAAGQIGVTPFDGMTAQTLQAALEQIQADIGGNYGGADGAGKVGYTPSEGVDEDTVQAAIEAVQANLTAYIAKIKAATGAAEVGNAPIAGMTATNVQHALEELRKNIDNIVSGIIPGGSITSEMIQDGAVTADKLGSDVTGDTIPTSASDPTTISSQLSNRLLIHANNAAGLDCNLLIKDGRYQIKSPNILNAPPWIDPTYGHFFIDVFHHMDIRVRQTAYEVNSTRMYMRACLFGSWSQWEPIATATPPQEYDIPFRSGWQANGVKATYCKSQEGICIVDCSVYGSGTASDNFIASLPAGFCPSANFGCAAHAYKGGVRGIAEAQITYNGDIVIYSPIEFDYVSFSCAFVAGN